MIASGPPDSVGEKVGRALLEFEIENLEEIIERTEEKIQNVSDEDVERVLRKQLRENRKNLEASKNLLASL